MQTLTRFSRRAMLSRAAWVGESHSWLLTSPGLERRVMVWFFCASTVAVTW